MVKNQWYPVKLNELDFTQQDRVKQRVHISTHPELNGGEPVLVKLAVWPWEIASMEVETTVYQRINGGGIGPKFLGHLAEGRGGRVIGLVVECVRGARAAGPGDLEGCRKALGRLHALGIKHGDINKHNFLVQDGHDVVLVDLETAKHGCSPQELDDEMNGLESSLDA
jgi:predicted Ser/Thr protein kinase